MSAFEGIKVAGLDLNDGTNFEIDGESFKFTPAQPKAQWAGNPNADNDILIREPTYGPAYFEFTVRVEPQKTMAAALEKCGQITDAIQACKRADGGAPLEWTPAGTETTYTWYAELAEHTDLPVVVSGSDAGWFINSPVVKVKLTCSSAGETAERIVKALTESGAEPLQTLYVPGIKGDLPAKGRLIFTDAATQARRYVELGMDVVSGESNPALLLTAANLTVSGLAGTSTTRAGAYSEEKVKRLATTPIPLTFCGTGAIKHVGSYRLKARIYAASEDIRIQAAYRNGNGPLVTLDWVEPICAGEWIDVDLGEVIFEEAEEGEQHSEILFNGKTVGTTGEALDLNYLTLVPTLRHIEIRRPLAPLVAPTVFAAHDEFDQEAGVLSGKTLPSGGAWATSGSAKGDFQVVKGETHAVQRNAKEDSEWRIATSPYSAASLVAAQISWNWSALPTEPLKILMSSLQLGEGLLPLTAEVATDGSGHLVDGSCRLVFGETFDFPWQAGTTYTFTILASPGNFAAAWVTTNGAFPSGEPTLFIPHLAVSVAGKIRFLDRYTGAQSITRTYDNFAIWVPSLAPVCNSGKSMEFNTDLPLTLDSTGKFWGPSPFPRGGRFYLAPAGGRGWINRLALRGRRNDIVAEADPNVTDKDKVEVLATERFLMPR